MSGARLTQARPEPALNVAYSSTSKRFTDVICSAAHAIGYKEALPEAVLHIAEAQAAEVRERYNEPQRAYHTTTHIIDCLEQLALVKALCNNYVAVSLALLYHDAIYDPTAKDSELQSAELAVHHLSAISSACRCDGSLLISEVKRLIMLTCHGASTVDAEDIDGQILVDIDLSILGRNQEVFDRYESEIRKEYCHVPEAAYRTGRAKVLQHFLDQPRIYRHKHFSDAFEAQARLNLAASLARLADLSKPLL
jgi:predicted metal-dependent HD superfamily phosphohydrolase